MLGVVPGRRAHFRACRPSPPPPAAARAGTVSAPGGGLRWHAALSWPLYHWRIQFSPQIFAGRCRRPL
eukprot:5598924-Pyramimonas_sp.AAC.1